MFFSLLVGPSGQDFFSLDFGYGPSFGQGWFFLGAAVKIYPFLEKSASLLRYYLQKNRFISRVTYKFGGNDYFLGMLLAILNIAKIFSPKHDTIVLEKIKKYGGKPSRQLPNSSQVFLSCASIAKSDCLEKTNRRWSRMARRRSNELLNTWVGVILQHGYPSTLVLFFSLITFHHTMSQNNLTSNMEEILSSLWNSLSITDPESTNIFVDPTKLSIPDNTLVGKLAMKKFVSLIDIEKGLKFIWELKDHFEINRLGVNTFLFSFKDNETCERILENQPWNYRGSILMVDKLQGEECLTNLSMHEVPFWIQVHGLQI